MYLKKQKKNVLDNVIFELLFLKYLKTINNESISNN